MFASNTRFGQGQVDSMPVEIDKSRATAEYTPPSYVRAAGCVTVYDLFKEAAARNPDARSLVDRSQAYTYRQTLRRVDSIAAAMAARGLCQGDRVAVLAENCCEYIELHLAAACLGIIVACQNWRLNNEEVEKCVKLVSPSLLLYTSRFADTAEKISKNLQVDIECLQIGIADWVERFQGQAPPQIADIETGLLILYTSGTTGPAKAALISQRALIARMILLRTDLEITADDGFVAWAPMFHMGGSEHSLSTLMIGGTVFVADGFDVDRIAHLIGTEQLGWLLLVPSTIDRLLESLDRQKVIVKGVRRVGAMADLLPKRQVAMISGRLDAPFLNTFGATETGIAPASGHSIPAGEEPERLSKVLNSLCSFRLTDELGRDVAPGEVGEATVKGPTLFSGYWRDNRANKKDFSDGWFRMGDLFRQNKEGTFDFCGRAKYLIKSGGENIYPAEIEAILLADARVLDAVVISSRDEQWGEIPVAVIASEFEQAENLSADLMASCRNQLASYKCPKKVILVSRDRLVRNTSGKLDRNDLERQLKAEGLIN